MTNTKYLLRGLIIALYKKNIHESLDLEVLLIIVDNAAVIYLYNIQLVKLICTTSIIQLLDQSIIQILSHITLNALFSLY